MSDREKLIELIDRVLQCLPWGEVSTHTSKDIADHLISNGVTLQKWIPVSDETRKPKDRRNYFIAYVFGDSTMTFYGEAKYHAAGDNGYVQGAHFSNEGVDGMRVTHWMEIPPLPEPPKECE